METDDKIEQNIQPSEVYVSDIPELKKIFLKIFRVKSVDENFGIPFLLMKKGNDISAFASLIINENKIDFTIYENPDIPIKEKEKFNEIAKKYYKRSNSANFRNADHLKNRIIRMIDWLNV